MGHVGRIYNRPMDPMGGGKVADSGGFSFFGSAQHKGKSKYTLDPEGAYIDPRDPWVKASLPGCGDLRAADVMIDSIYKKVGFGVGFCGWLI